jgi:phosphate:Na+ symporter
MLLAGGLHGAARRLASFQALFKALGAMLLVIPLVVWRLVQSLPDPFAAPDSSTVIDLPHQLGLLFVALQLLPALLLLPAYPWLPRLLERLSPATREEALARPQFLYEQALEDAPTALDLAGREQARLLDRLPGLLDPVREEGAPPELSRPALSAASAAVERAVANFLQEVLARGCPREELERAVALENLNGLITALRETASELVAGLESALRREAEDPVRALAPPLVEALHLLLSELAEAALSGDPIDAATLAELAADRSDMMDGLRRRVSRASAAMPPDGLNLLFRVTALFERAVWLIRRSALLLSPANDDRHVRALAPVRAEEGAAPVHLPS